MAPIQLSAADRKALLGLYRSAPDPQVRHRAHILLLLGDGAEPRSRATDLPTR